MKHSFILICCALILGLLGTVESLRMRPGGAFAVTAAAVSSSTADNEKEKEASGKSGVQFMITKKMRNTLIDDLGYLAEEVNVMEPQIAAVVIEKSLNRPKKGMPVSWRRSEGGGGSTRTTMYKVTKKLKQLLHYSQRKAVSVRKVLVAQSQRPAVQAAIGAVTLLMLKDPICGFATNLGSAITAKVHQLTQRPPQLSTYKLSSSHQSRGLLNKGLGWRLPWSSARNGDVASEVFPVNRHRDVDLYALSRVQDIGLWDKISMHLSKNSRSR